MRIFVPVWYEYVSDCPADLEVVDASLLAVCTSEALAMQAIKLFVAGRIEEFGEDWEEMLEDRDLTYDHGEIEPEFAIAADGYFVIENYELDKLDNVFPLGSGGEKAAAHRGE